MILIIEMAPGLVVNLLVWLHVELPQAPGKHRPLPGLCRLPESRAVMSQEQLFRCVYAIPTPLLRQQTSPATTLTLGRQVHRAPR